MTHKPTDAPTRLLMSWLAGPATAGAILLLGAAFARFLPDPLATHFGLSGHANGAMPLWVGLAIAPVVAGIPMLARATAPPAERARVWAAAATFGVLLQVLLIWSNYGVSDWRLADGHGLWTLIPLLGLPVLASVAAGRIVPRAASPAMDLAHEGRASELALHKAAVWSSSAHNRFVFVAGILLAAVQVAMGAYPFALAGLVVLPFSSLRLTAGDSGLVMSLGRPAVFRRRYAKEQIVRASVGNYQGLGWGYRGSRQAFGTASWAVRRGECLVIEFRDGSSLQFTVDDAQRGADVINAALVRT